MSKDLRSGIIQPTAWEDLVGGGERRTVWWKRREWLRAGSTSPGELGQLLMIEGRL